VSNGHAADFEREVLGESLEEGVLAVVKGRSGCSKWHVSLVAKQTTRPSLTVLRILLRVVNTAFGSRY
jgi:hypothetical protein